MIFDITCILTRRRRQWCCASHRKISRPPARIFLRANHCHCFIPATSGIRKFFPFRGDSQPQARIPAAKLSRSAAFEGTCFWERKVWLSIVSSPRRPRWSAGDFSFCARLFSFREGLLSGLREKGRTVHFPFLPCVLSALKITDNSIYLLISRLINILYLVLRVVASDWRIEAYKDAFEKKYDKLHEVVWQITRGSCPKLWQITRGRPFGVWQITRGFSGLKKACEKQFSHVDW